MLHDEILSAEQSGARSRNLNRAARGAAGNGSDQVSVGEDFEVCGEAVEGDPGGSGQVRAQDGNCVADFSGEQRHVHEGRAGNGLRGYE